jgi:hypothetical protein
MVVGFPLDLVLIVGDMGEEGFYYSEVYSLILNK